MLFVRFVTFFNEIHLANDMIPKMLENSANEINITIRLNVDGVIFEM